MRPYRSQGQTINNFFTLVTIIVMSIVLTIYVKYVPEPPRQHSNLECQKINYTFDKIYNQSLLNEASTLLNKGAYVLDGGLIEPRFGKSYLKDTINVTQSNAFFEKHIFKQSSAKNYFVTIKYEIVENDKNDPRKKDESCKLHAGSLMTSFRINGKEAFRMHADFIQYDKKAIEEKIECTVKAFRYNAK